VFYLSSSLLLSAGISRGVANREDATRGGHLPRSCSVRPLVAPACEAQQRVGAHTASRYHAQMALALPRHHGCPVVAEQPVGHAPVAHHGSATRLRRWPRGDGITHSPALAVG